MKSPASAFYVFTTEPNKERAAEVILRKRDLLAIVPTIKVPCRARGTRGRAVLRTVALIPGYVFVELDGSDRSISAVFRFRVIHGIVEFGGIPGRIEKAVMEEFIDRALTPPPAPHKPELRVGGLVEVQEGAFVRHQGRLLRLRGARCEILLQLFGASREVTVKTDSVAPIEALGSKEKKISRAA